MGQKNYSKFSKHFKNKHNDTPAVENVHKVEKYDVDVDVDSETLQMGLESAEVLKEARQEAAQDANTEVIGFVIECDKLYVRKEANKDAKPLCIIEKDAEVKVDLGKSTYEFYKVFTASGVEGYCMKKFIAIK